MVHKKQVIEEFHKRGKRITQQRLGILDILSEKEWSSCKEIYWEASKRDPSIGLSTVYRTISTLEELGILKRGYQYLSPPEEDETLLY